MAQANLQSKYKPTVPVPCPKLLRCKHMPRLDVPVRCSKLKRNYAMFEPRKQLNKFIAQARGGTPQVVYISAALALINDRVYDSELLSPLSRTFPMPHPRGMDLLSDLVDFCGGCALFKNFWDFFTAPKDLFGGCVCFSAFTDLIDFLNNLM